MQSVPSTRRLKQSYEKGLAALIRNHLAIVRQHASADQFQRMAGVEALKAASVLMAAIPMLVFYPFIQRYFIRGIMLGAVKA